jgi:NADPH:quinone reductase-like Zn-dependent oxidoreductase
LGAFFRLQVAQDDTSKSILVIGAAGGVGSILVQLAKLTKLNIIATASREVTTAWLKELGADTVINHHKIK